MPNVTFQVIPFTAGSHPALGGGGFVILGGARPIVNNVVYVEGVAGNIYMESATDLERFKSIFSRLKTIALDPEDSAAAVTRIAATYQAA